MQSIKCPQCGLVMLAGAPVCKSCGASLAERRTQQPMNTYQVGSLDREDKQQSQSSTLSRLPFLTLVLGWLLLAASRHIGVIAWPIALVMFLTGVVTSVILIVLRIRSRNEQARLWPPATALVIHSGLLLKCTVVLAAFALTSALSGKAPQWREYVSTDGGYTIQMPDEPEVSFDQINGKAGQVPMHSLFANLQANGSCTAIYFDYSEYKLTIPVAEFLDNGINLFLKNFNSTLISKKAITLDGYEGVEFEATPNSNSGWSPTRSTARIFWAPDKKFVYVIHIMGPVSGPLYSQRSTFLNSFRFTEQLERDEAARRALANPAASVNSK